MNLIICDDNPVELQRLQERLEAYEKENGKNMRIVPYEHSTVLYDDLDRKQMGDIYILDIDMPVMNGLELAQRIHAIDMNIPVVFLTSHPEYASSAFKVQAFRYISKMQIETELWEAVDSAIEYREKLCKFSCLTFKSDGNCYRIPYDQIQYAKKAGKNIELHTLFRSFLYRDEMRKLLEALNDSRFVRIDRGCMVNLDFVEGYSEHFVRIAGAPELSISRRMLPDFKRAFARRWMADIAQREKGASST